MVFGIRYGMDRINDVIRENFGLSEEGFHDLKHIVRKDADSVMRSTVKDIFFQLFLDMYGYDYRSLKTDLSKQIFLNGKVELSHEERQRMLRCLSGYMSEHGETALVHEILKHLSTLD